MLIVILFKFRMFSIKFCALAVCKVSMCGVTNLSGSPARGRWVEGPVFFFQRFLGGLGPRRVARGKLFAARSF